MATGRLNHQAAPRECGMDAAWTSWQSCAASQKDLQIAQLR